MSRKVLYLLLALNLAVGLMPPAVPICRACPTLACVCPTLESVCCDACRSQTKTATPTSGCACYLGQAMVVPSRVARPLAAKSLWAGFHTKLSSSAPQQLPTRSSVCLRSPHTPDISVNILFCTWSN